MRLFVAVEVPEAIKLAVETDVVGSLRDKVAGARWARPEGRHLTLKFLGNVDDGRVTEIAVALRASAARHGPFRSSFGELGGFPSLRRPRVLWLGVGEGADAMGALATDVERELEALGFPPEARPFHGHLTLARFRQPQVIEELPAVAVPSEGFDVEEIVLFESKLHPKGARYSAVERLRLR